MSHEFYVRTAPFRAFVRRVNEIVDAEAAPERAIASLKASFSALLLDDLWLPDEYARPATASGMGSGIGSFLLYRRSDHSLSVSSLVISPGTMTPIHDHLAWGLVGLYRGEQHEEVFQRRGTDPDTGALDLIERRHLRRGDFYDLIPPHGDIHRVVAADDGPSVSIHLLRNDVGCVHRHRFDLESAAVAPFRSGYVNVPCTDEETT